MGSPIMPPILNLRPLLLLCLTPQQESDWGWRSMRSFCGFPRQNPGLYFPALPVSDHTLLVPPGELARQASLGGVPALSPLISGSVSRWIHHGVIKAINKFPDCQRAGPGTHCSLYCAEFQRAHTTPETMPHFLPGSHRPKPVSWARPRALAKPLSPSQTYLAIPMTGVIIASLASKSRCTRGWRQRTTAPGRMLLPKSPQPLTRRSVATTLYHHHSYLDFMLQPLPGAGVHTSPNKPLGPPGTPFCVWLGLFPVFPKGCVYSPGRG